MLKISINQVPDFIKLAKLSRNNILIVGNPGVGKSQVIEGMRTNKCKITTMTGSSTIEEIVNGIPQVNKEVNVLEYIEQKWFKEMEDFATNNPDGMQILFLDEFNTADPQVLKTFLTILAERRIPTLNKSLPEQVVIVAAMNPNDQNDTERLIRPMASRFMVLEAVSTIETYKNYIEGKEQDSFLKEILSEEELPVTKEQSFALLDQITEEEWNAYNENDDEKSYHEINPRSFSALLRALAHVTDKKKSCALLSKAFLGKALKWVEDYEEQKKVREEKLKKGDVFATEEELRAMSSEALEKYYEQISKPTVTGSRARECRLLCKKIMRENAEENKATL